MDITYLRSSSFGSWEFCQHKFFISSNLGIDEPSNKKADMGTVCHKVLEILACLKKAQQEKNIYGQTPDTPIIYKDDIVGEITIPDDMLVEYKLDDIDVQTVNDTRGNTNTYKPEHQLKKGHKRYGVELVNSLIPPVFDYYKSKSPHKWYPQDYKDCVNWVWMALDFNNGQFDPRRQNIVQPECRFDITIDKPWASYDINGVKGQLSFKGTIDLIIDNGYGYEIIDYKTGQRKNWAKGYVKDYKHFENDPQLTLYYYAARKLFPEIESIGLTIFWIRDGGPFSLCFDDEYITRAEKLLARQFNEIKRCSKPRLCDPTQKSFKCEKLCHFYKTSFKEGEENICRTIEKSIKEVGLEKTVELYTKIGHSISRYKPPGE
jgi:hypothetical protein